MPSKNSAAVEEPREDWTLEELQDEAEDLRTRINRFRKSLGRFFVKKQDLIDLMVGHPDLIQRPIVEKGSRAILARPAERLKEIL